MEYNYHKNAGQLAFIKFVKGLVHLLIRPKVEWKDKSLKKSLKGKGDVFIAGGSDSFSSLAFSGFHALHALDENACSPFNHSTGITLGGGSGILVIESYEHAVERGV